VSLRVSLGERISKLRKQHNWTQDELANKIGIHSRHVSRLENDKMRPKASTLSRLAEVFNLSLDELLANDHDAQPTIHDPQLLRTFQQAQELDDEDKHMVVRMVQALLTKKRMEQAIRL